MSARRPWDWENPDPPPDYWRDAFLALANADEVDGTISEAADEAAQRLLVAEARRASEDAARLAGVLMLADYGGALIRDLLPADDRSSEAAVYLRDLRQALSRHRVGAFRRWMRGVWARSGPAPR